MKGAASADAPSVRTRARWSKPRSPSFAAVAERGPRLVTTTPVLVLPGYGDSGPEHWQSLWEAEDPACRRVVQRDWMLPRLEDWPATSPNARGLPSWSPIASRARWWPTG